MMRDTTYSYETGQALQGALSDSELAALRQFLARAGRAVAAWLGRLSALARGA